MTIDGSAVHVDRSAATSEPTLWQQKVIERSLEAERRRVLATSADFVAVARELLVERGSFEFTLQDLVDRSEHSMRSFYQFFAGKDELLMAVLEEAVAAFAAHLRPTLESIDDPLGKLEAYVGGLWSAAGGARGGGHESANRALVAFHRHLEVHRPAELARIYRPQRALVAQAIDLGVACGALRTDIAADSLADLFFELSRAANHTAALAVGEGSWTATDLWHFCKMAITCRPPGR